MSEPAIEARATLSRWPLRRTGIHLFLLAICLATFLTRYWSSYEALAGFRMPLRLMDVIVSQPQDVAGGFFDRYNSGILNLQYQAYFGLARLAGRDAALTVLYLFQSALLIIAVYVLALALVRLASIAFLVTFLLLTSNLIALPHVGANGSPGPWPCNYYLGMSVVFLGCAFLFSGRRYLYAGLMLLAFLCHQPLGVLAFAALLPTVWLHTKGDRRFAIWHAGTFCLLVLAMYLRMRWAGPAETGTRDELWFHMVRLFNSGHVFPDAGCGYWFPFWLFLVTMVAGMACCVAQPAYRRTLLPTIIAGSAIFFGSLPFLYGLPVVAVYLILPIRISTLLAGFVLVFTLAEALSRLRSGQSWSVSCFASVAIGAAATGCDLGVLLYAVAITLLAAVTAKRPWRIPLGVVAVAIPCVLLLLKSTQMGLGQFSQRLPVAALVVAACLCYRGAAAFPRLLLPARALAGGGACVAVFLVTLTYGPIVQLGSLQGAVDEFTEICRQMREQVPPGRPVLLPPETAMPTFEALAERGGLLQLRKVAWVYSSPNLKETLVSTLRDFGIDVATMESRSQLLDESLRQWRCLSADRFRELGRKYGARFLITFRDHDLDLPVYYQGESYRVYVLEEAPVAPQRLAGTDTPPATRR